MIYTGFCIDPANPAFYLPVFVSRTGHLYPVGLPEGHPRDGRNLTGEEMDETGILSAAPVIFRNRHQIFALLLLGNPDGNHSFTLRDLFALFYVPEPGLE